MLLKIMKRLLHLKLSSSNNVRLKKKNVYSKALINYTSQLKNILNEKQKYKKLKFYMDKEFSRKFLRTRDLKKKGSIILYSIFFSFSAVNTFLYVTDALGNLKFRYSAGLLNFKGKLKKNRFQILKLFFKKLRKLKISVLKNRPIALYFKNVGSYRHLIIRNIKKKLKLFIRVIHNYQSHSYNGCRKKKRPRK